MMEQHQSNFRRSYLRWLWILLTSLATTATTFSAALPHVEQLAPGIYAAGFGDRYGSANCGWVALNDQTLLIDLPHGIAIPDFLAEVTKTTGKPVRHSVLTHTQELRHRVIAVLIQQGLTEALQPRRSGVRSATQQHPWSSSLTAK